MHTAQTPAGSEPPEIREQRRRARRTALLLGVVAFFIYVGFIVATGLRG
jgi:uncharacterized membrane protein (DUF485 family)